jgi:hypothetical protein
LQSKVIDWQWNPERNSRDRDEYIKKHNILNDYETFEKKNY